MSENTLKEWADKNSPFLRLEDGESAVLTYKKYEFVPSTYDPKKQVVQYTFEDLEGNEKLWGSSSNKIARFFADKVGGELVEIKREGVERNTKYDIKQLTDKEIEALEEKKTEDAVDDILDVDKGGE